MNARRGSVLLEILLSIALFAGAAVFTLMALRNALAGTQRSAVRMRAVDLAASRMAEIERGIEGDEEATAADPDGLRMAVETEPSAFPGLVLTTVRVLGPAGEGTVAGVSGVGPRSVATVTFDGPAGTRRFIVSHGALEPL